MISRGLLLCALALTLVGNALAAAGKVERIGAIANSTVSDGLRQALEDKGYRVTLDDGWTAEFWFIKQLKMTSHDVPGALYPGLTDGELVVVVNFPQGFSDYRGQNIAAGIYTLRYQLLPQDGNHMGVAPNPDFLLAIPAAADSRPEQSYVFRKLVALSAKSTGGSHPAVVAMESAGDSPAVAKTDHGTVVVSLSVTTGSGATEKIGIVIKGSGTQ